MVTKVVSIERAESAQAVRIARLWSLPCLLPGEDTSQPLSRSLEIFLVFVVETNKEAKDERGWCLEWAIVRKGSGGNDEEVEEETERSEAHYDAGNDLVDGEEVVGKGITKEEQTSLKHERQRLHDEVEVPGNHSVHLTLSMPTAVDNGSTHLDLGITIEPLFA